MAALLAPPASSAPTYLKVANYPGLYRHARSGRYYACKKLGGIRRERSLGTCDREIAKRRLREWSDNLARVDAEVEKTTLGELIARFEAVNGSAPRNTVVTTNAIIQCFLRWWPHGTDFQVRHIRPSSLDEWLALQEPRLRNTTYNRYAGFLKQLFDIAVKDRILVESPAKSLRLPWKKPQTPKRIIPSPAELQAIVESIRSQRFADTAQDTADFVEFLGLAGLGQAEASSLTWGDVDWSRGRLHIRRHKTDTRFYVPIYPPLRPLLERLRVQAGGERVAMTARVFKIKDAKKALRSACERLGLPLFSQRSLRQGLIMRLWKAGVDKKLIARWQGHQDGGQLIMDTYTEVFGGDDEEYERGQLAKLGGGVHPTGTVASQSSGQGGERTTSVFMDTPEPVDPVEPATAPPAATPKNPYRKGDKVKTKCKGEEVDAEVTVVFEDEVQVRTPDGELRWRTVRTVTAGATTPVPEARAEGAAKTGRRKRSKSVGN